MTSSTEASRSCGLLALLLLAGSACADPMRPEPMADASLTSGLVVSALHAATGDTIALLPTVRTGDGTLLMGVQGKLDFNPHRLRYLGQPLQGEAFVLVNSSRAAEGQLQVASLQVEGLAERTADLRFEVLGGDWRADLEYVLVEAATRDARPLRNARGTGLTEGLAPAAREIRQLNLDDWARWFGIREPERLRVPGAGTIYGDANLNGEINILDAAFVANVSVGNLPLLTDANRDYVIAGDVSPANLPGLGEATDPIPPGRNADGSFTITIVDAAEIANEAVGNNRPIPGEPVPGRGARSGHLVLPARIDSSRTLHRDTVYELQGNVIVGPGATLSVEAGTRIEGDPATRGALVVARAGNLMLRGTRTEPIVFSCKATSPVPGCWGGVVINGLALLNNRDPGVTGFCPEKFSIGSTELYGGCLVQDTTGAIEYVRIEYAGRSAGSGPVPGLALLGVGAGTAIDNVQIHGSLGDGLYLSGGNVSLRHVVLTANYGAGLHWDHGWGGNHTGGSAQFVQIQMPANGGDGILGSNLLGNADAGPRSEPDLYNVTVISDTAGAGRGLVLRDGSAGTLRNSIVLRTAGAGYDIEGASSCGQVSGGNAGFDHNISFAGDPDYASDSDCIDEAAFASAAAQQNRVLDPQLLAPFNTLTPDTRPLAGGASSTGAVTPPSNFFFDLTALYVGAVKPANTLGSDIPWYAGWTRGWTGVMP